MSAARLGHGVAWVAVLAMLVPWGDPGARGTRTASRAAALLGPVASLAASAQWVRFDLALRDGQPELAYARAEVALALDPRSSRGWHTLARHLVFDRASFEREVDPERRRRWIRAGLDVLERGERACARPADLASVRGAILSFYVAEIAADVGWPGGREAALNQGARALERAARLGDARASEYAGYAADELAR